MKTHTPIVLIVLFLIFGFGWQLSSQQRITRWAQMLTLESGGQVYELPQVLEPPQHSTFFSLQLSNAPPFPFRPLDFPVYALGDAYVFDDLDFDWVEARALGLSLFGGSSALQKGGQIIAADGPPSPGDGGGGGSTNYPFPSAYGYTNGELYLRINAVALAWADLSLHNSEPTYYQLLSKENLEEEGWTLEQTFLGAAETNVTFISNPTLERPQLFFMARQLPQAIRLNFTNTFVTTNLVPATIEGNPTNFAILVNDTNFASATWTTFSNAAITVTLGATNGNYDVWFGYINGTTNWSVTRLVLDSIAPTLVITAPSGSTTSRPTIQLQGYSLESLAGLEYTVTNLDGSTSGAGFVTGQDFNTNTFQATTNWFQCFDVPLAEGTNLVTLQAMDLAGNIFTTNLSYTLDFSGDTTAPTITVNWPQNGATVAASNFTLLGALNDGTAQVKIIGASSETFGQVGRSGNFSAGPLSLPGATNLFTIIATDAAGNSSTQQLTLHKSAVQLTINPATNLHQTNTTVTGTVSHTNQSVWVNGVQATVYTDGSWIATNVPVGTGGSVSFNVFAGTILNDPSGTELTVEQDRPLVRRANYWERMEREFRRTSHPWNVSISSRSADWSEGLGGLVVGQSYSGNNDMGGIDFPESYTTCFGGFSLPLEDWDPADIFNYEQDCSNVFGTNSYSFPYEIPWEFSDVSFSDVHPNRINRYSRKTQTNIELLTGGSVAPGAMSVVLLTVEATEWRDSLADPNNQIADWGALPLPPESIKIREQTLKPSPTNALVGKLYLQLPSDSTNDITPVVTKFFNQKFYTFDVKAIPAISLLKEKANIYAKTTAPITCLNTNDNQMKITIQKPPEITGSVDLVIDKVIMYIGSETPAYTPPDQGTLVQLNDTNWLYTTWTEPATNIHPRAMRVYVKAKVNGFEMGATDFRVQTAYMNIKDKKAWSCAYDFIRWKYATVLDATGGFFTSTNFASTPTVGCIFTPAEACTFLSSVTFGTDTFTDTENAAASTIGHELTHTDEGGDSNECEAYYWELQNKALTGTDSSDNTAVLQNIAARVVSECD